MGVKESFTYYNVETINKIAESLDKTVDFYRSKYSAIETISETKEQRKFGKSGVFYNSVREYAKDKDLSFVGVRASESKRRKKAAGSGAWPRSCQQSLSSERRAAGAFIRGAAGG